MNNAEKRDDMLAAEYALGTLRGGARLQFQKRLANEPALAARVAYWQEMLSTLDSHLVPIPPLSRCGKKLPSNCRLNSRCATIDLTSAGWWQPVLPPLAS